MKKFDVPFLALAAMLLGGVVYAEVRGPGSDAPADVGRNLRADCAIDGSTDDTTALRTAIAASKKLLHPGGTLIITDTIDMSGLPGGVSMKCAGQIGSCIIQWGGDNTSGVMLDFAGSLFVDFDGITLIAPSAKPAGIGMLFGRTGTGSSDVHRLTNVKINGYFTIANVYSVTSERQTWVAPYIENDYASASSYAFFRGDSNELSVTSDYQTLTAYDGNTTGAILGGQIYHLGGGIPFWGDGLSDFSMFGTDINTTGTRAFKFTSGFSNVNLIGVRQEGSANTQSIYLDSNAVYRGLSIIGGFLSSTSDGTGTNFCIYGADNATLQDSFIHPVRYNTSNVFNVDKLLRTRLNTTAFNATVRTWAHGNEILAGTLASLTLPSDKTGNRIYHTIGNDDAASKTSLYKSDFTNWLFYDNNVSYVGTNHMAYIVDQTPVSAGGGAGLSLGGNYRASPAETVNFVTLQGYKHGTATDNVAAGGLRVYSRSNAATMILGLQQDNTGLVDATAGLKIGTGTDTSKLVWNATASVSDKTAIAHGVGSAPTAVIATGSVGGEIVSVSAIASTTFTVRILKHDGTAGTAQTIYWMALK